MAQLIKLTTNASPRTLATASVGFSALAVYLYLKSITQTPGADILEVLKFVKWKREFNKKQSSDWSLADTIEESVSKYGKQQAIYYVDDNTSLTWVQLNERANQVAHWALSVGLKQGDVVALLMDNRPEFVITWMGLAKVGVCSSLINTYLTGKPLIHSLSVCKATHAIIGIEHAERVAAVRDQLAGAIPGTWYVSGGVSPNLTSIDGPLQNQSMENPPRSVRNQTNCESNLFYIYTSGTTGHPKASVIKHLRYYSAAAGFGIVFGFSNKDRLYCCLPLYHSAGGMIGTGLNLAFGSTLILRKKFSTSNFWKDVTEHNCTSMQYIGELCRYLVAAPVSEYDRKHKVRIAIGNGMRPDVWKQFQERFGIPQIGEFYGATEGNCNMINTRGRFSAVGYISPLVAPLFPIKLVKFDVETEEPIRGPNGLCIPCGVGEVGELLGFINPEDPSRAFDGYTDEKATKKKILRDVFKKGDSWFRSGDLLKKDQDGYFYFIDRIGDTFRWKGENVATGEVAEVLSVIPGVLEVNVYGVQIPGHDGRAGMACLVVNDQFDFDQLYQVSKAQLPVYAQPLFLRIQGEIEITTTFKHKKAELKKEGFDPTKISDALYFRDVQQEKYIRIDEDLYKSITTGQRARL